ncbi:conserved Plasmodium protein, unknown function [Plasmodium ovale]|uniref:Dynein attachment factor N-terminal domain-containing protein n=2 Tax=Plasmodium ovale TaxID=36330 RepID=A0A1A8VQC9_PLAOA|nr:conserved Plasmodium protein, unknown function [Plasmodium ovale curtisi]SBS87380.1 conserved Plasmodium protein, unknown function [Plasmodium ovale curtisi]SCP04024.1 conserved Plasmodium protein, unknown function [Plasmodium ovale]
MLSNDDVYPINLKKMRNDFVRSIVQDEEYKRKDDKKKEIVKTCKSYKEFCDIVSCINMKPVRKYEDKITYEDYVSINQKVNSSTHKFILQKVQKNNRQLLNFLSNNHFDVNTMDGKCPPTHNDEAVKTVIEIHRFLNVLNGNQDNYYAFIEKHYNFDELKEIINFIKNKWDLLVHPFTKVVTDNDVEEVRQKEGQHTILPKLIHFLFCIVKYWRREKLSAFFTPDERRDINTNVASIIENIEGAIYMKDEVNVELTGMISCIKEETF